MAAKLREEGERKELKKTSPEPNPVQEEERRGQGRNGRGEEGRGPEEG